MSDEINLKDDLQQYSQNILYKVEIQDNTFDLFLKSYNNINIIESLNKWSSCFGMLGKGNMYHYKDISRIVYCLLSDSYDIITIDNEPINIDLFDSILNRFLQIEILTKESRKIKLKVFPICKTTIVIDWKNFPNYKIYELYNIDQVKEYYKSNKISFDTVIKDISLQPIFCGNISDLKQDFKVLSLDKTVIDKEKNIKVLENFLKVYKTLEKQIQKEYKKLRDHP